MTTINAEPRPGTAYKTIMEERDMLDEFMAMVEKKMEADKRHLDDLINLQKTWNPKWNDGGIWGLISPLLTHLTEEITYRKAAHEDILSQFTTIVQPANDPDCGESAFDPREMNKGLDRDYLECEQCRQSVATPEAQEILGRARDRVNTINLAINSPPSEPLLPAVDRAYRIAVNKQHRNVSTAEAWYTSKLGGNFDRHQQRAEDIKTFVLGCCGSLGKLASDLSASSSHASHSTQVFASTRFIAPRYDEMEQEKSHLLLRRFEYRNFYDGRVVEPIFGLGPQRTLTLANQILDAIPKRNFNSLSSYPSDWIGRIFDMEEQSLTDHALGVPNATALHRIGDLLPFLKFTVWSEQPFFPVTLRHVDEFPNGIPRKKLRQIVELIQPEIRGSVMALWTRLNLKFTTDFDIPHSLVAAHLCHDWKASTIIDVIWRKWDLHADRPLPDGVTRQVAGPWYQLSSRLVWTKTGQTYVPPTPPGNGVQK